MIQFLKKVLLSVDLKGLFYGEMWIFLDNQLNFLLKIQIRLDISKSNTLSLKLIAKNVAEKTRGDFV